MYWFTFLCCDLAIPAALVYFGRRMQKQPRRQINDLHGYRTVRSMRNEQTWAFAQDCSSRLLWRLGWAGMILSILALLPLLHSSKQIISTWAAGICLLQCVLLPVLAIVPVELALKRSFREDGTPRSVPLRRHP